MKHNKRFYNFITTNQKNELYVYGAIVGGIDKWDESDVTFADFRDTLDAMSDNSTLDVMINSCGGDVFTTQSIIAMLRRAKERNITVNAYIDGLGASCASWLPMIADNIYIYPQSVMMIHKPMAMARGNANDMKKEIEILDKIEDEVIIPLYLSRAKDGVTKEMLQDKMAKETWLSAEEIIEMFNVTLLEDERQIACCVDKDIMSNFVNVPDNIKALMEKEVKNMEDEVKDSIVENAEITEEVETEIVENSAEEVIEEGTEEIVAEETVEEVVEDTNEEVIEETVEETVEEVTNEADTKIIDFESEIENLKAEKAELENKLNVANEKIIELNDKIELLSPIVDKYNAEMAEKKAIEDAKIVEEKREYYKNKFDRIGARGKFESEEVQNLISNCVADEKAISKLNNMLVDMINVTADKVVVNNRIETITKIENLIPTEETVESKYGFL